MDFLGIKLDSRKNYGLRGKEQIISAEESRVKVIVIPTDEELIIATDTWNILTK
jgi:acetate kinase